MPYRLEIVYLISWILWYLESVIYAEHLQYTKQLNIYQIR